MKNIEHYQIIKKDEYGCINNVDIMTIKYILVPLGKNLFFRPWNRQLYLFSETGNCLNHGTFFQHGDYIYTRKNGVAVKMLIDEEIPI
jgi:hypothetical protein